MYIQLPDPGGGRFPSYVYPYPHSQMNQPTYPNCYWQVSRSQETQGLPSLPHQQHHPHSATSSTSADEAMQLQEDEEEKEYAASKEEFGERIKEELDIKEIQQTLSRSNYKRKFHNLICWEEKTHIDILQMK